MGVSDMVLAHWLLGSVRNKIEGAEGCVQRRTHPYGCGVHQWTRLKAYLACASLLLRASPVDQARGGDVRGHAQLHLSSGGLPFYRILWCFAGQITRHRCDFPVSRL